MDKFISSYTEQRTIFLADTDSYTVMKNGFTEKDLIFKIKIATLLYENVFIPAAYMWQSEAMSEVMYKIQSLILTENVLPVIRKTKETRDIKDYFEKRQSETSILKNLDVYKVPELSSEIASEDNKSDMACLHSMNICLHLEEKSVKDEFISLWHKDLINSLDINSISGILYQSNIDSTSCKTIINELKNNVDYENFSRAILIDYVINMGLNDSVKCKLEERISWLYLKANAIASDSDFYISQNMSDLSVYKANLSIYAELLSNFGITNNVINTLTCEDLIRIKASPEYIKFISYYIQIINDIYVEQEDIIEKANQRIDSIIGKERLKKGVISKMAGIVATSKTVFMGLLINHLSGSSVNMPVFLATGGISVFDELVKRFEMLNKVFEKTSFFDFKEYILKKQYKEKMNKCINGVIL